MKKQRRVKYADSSFEADRKADRTAKAETKISCEKAEKNKEASSLSPKTDFEDSEDPQNGCSEEASVEIFEDRPFRTLETA